MASDIRLKVAEVRFTNDVSEMYAWFYPNQQAVKLTPVQIQDEIDALKAIQKRLVHGAEVVGLEPTILSMFRHFVRWLKDLG